MGIRKIVNPSSEPYTLDEVKQYLKIDEDIQDPAESSYINSLITGAREYCEDHQNRAYMTQTWEYTLDKFNSTEIELPRPPLQSVISIKYKDYTGDEKIIQESDYIVDSDSYIGKVVPAYGKSWPSFIPYPVNAIRIRFICGYGDAAAVPQKIKQAVLFLISHWYENRLPVGKLDKETEFTVTALLSQDRVIPV